MTTKTSLSAVLAFSLLLGVCTTSAWATQKRLYVASNGNDSDDGSIGKPKKTFAGALTDLSVNGEIIALDTANYGAATITHSTTITAEPGVVAYVSVTGTNSGLTIATGSSDTVTLRGLNISGGSRGSASTGSGLNVTSVGALRVENCKFTYFNTAINLNATTSVSMVVEGGNAFLVNNGISALSTSSSTTVSATFSDFEIDGASSAVFAFASTNNGAVTNIMLNKCVVSGNGTALSATGPGAAVWVGNSTLSGNGTSTSTANSGNVYSFGNNQVAFNGTGPGFTTQPLQ